MTRIDERLGVGAYLSATMKTVDGMAWIMTCLASALCLIDISLGTNLIPLRDMAKPSKALTLLLFSPLLIFLILVWLRQLPFGSYRTAIWIRAICCVAVFLLINF